MLFLSYVSLSPPFLPNINENDVQILAQPGQRDPEKSAVPGTDVGQGRLEGDGPGMESGSTSARLWS